MYCGITLKQPRAAIQDVYSRNQFVGNIMKNYLNKNKNKTKLKN